MAKEFSPPVTLTKQRDQTLDVLKGFGIILMVVGHSGAPIERFVYLFHMALFFMASGYTWSDSKVRDLGAVKQTVISRLKGLWLPFALGNGIFTLLNNLFLTIGLYSPADVLPKSLPQTAVSLFKNMFFAGEAQFGGATWFLRTLFMVFMAHMVIRYIASHWKYGKLFFYGVVVLTLAGTVYVNLTRPTFFMGIHTCFAGYTAFLLGMLLKKLQLTQRMGKFLPLAAVACFAVLLLMNPLDTVGLGAGNIGSLPFYLVVSLSGWIMVWGVSALLKGPVARAIAYCGRHSIWIVLLHFLAFKPVALAYLIITGGDLVNLGAFPVFAVPCLWPLYTLVGVVLPLGVKALADIMKPKSSRSA